MIPSHSHRSTLALPSLYHPSPEYHHHRDGKWAYHPISTRILIPSHPINTESKYHPIPSAPDSHYHPIPSMHFFMFPIPSHQCISSCFPFHRITIIKESDSHPIFVMVKLKQIPACGGLSDGIPSHVVPSAPRIPLYFWKQMRRAARFATSSSLLLTNLVVISSDFNTDFCVAHTAVRRWLII